jgi:hypothetical protein
MESKPVKAVEGMEEYRKQTGERGEGMEDQLLKVM